MVRPAPKVIRLVSVVTFLIAWASALLAALVTVPPVMVMVSARIVDGTGGSRYVYRSDDRIRAGNVNCAGADKHNAKYKEEKWF